MPRRRAFLRLIAPAAFLPMTAGGCAETMIRSVLHQQEEAWNRGDIEGFMDHYWKSDDLTFSSGGRTTAGWQATLDRYRSRYPTPAAMGKLEFGELRVRTLGSKAAMVLGTWRLTRPAGAGGDVGGNFTLVMQRIAGRWVIVHDHTSTAAPSGEPGTVRISDGA